jgi:hypothetical protein
VPVTQTKHRPLGLSANEEKKSGPQLYRPKIAHSGARQHAPTQADQNLGHGQTDDNRQQNRELTEFIHEGWQSNGHTLVAEYFFETRACDVRSSADHSRHDFAARGLCSCRALKQRDYRARGVVREC